MGGLGELAHRLPEVVVREVRVPLGHVRCAVTQEPRDRLKRDATLGEPRGEGPPEIVEPQIPDPGPPDGRLEVIHHVMRLVAMKKNGEPFPLRAWLSCTTHVQRSAVGSAGAAGVGPSDTGEDGSRGVGAVMQIRTDSVAGAGMPLTLDCDIYK